LQAGEIFGIGLRGAHDGLLVYGCSLEWL